jgi:hypothetical protein
MAGLNWRYVPPELDARPFRRFFAKVSADGQRRLARAYSSDRERCTDEKAVFVTRTRRDLNGAS